MTAMICEHPATGGWRCVACHPEMFGPRPAPADDRLTFVYDDGGRAEAGFTVSQHDAGDCVARAIAIATEQPYRTVYDALAGVSAGRGGRRSARDGLPKQVYRQYLDGLGWEWTPTMGIGTGCTVHMRPSELPSGRVIVALSKHLAAVVDGTVRDTSDPSRSGTRCVYGYWLSR